MINRRELLRGNYKQSDYREVVLPFTVIRLMVNLLFLEDADALTKKGVIGRIYGPACGTGGVLSVAENRMV
jgi:type I restriction enzyme M protein